jgi:hypothetical protein
MNNLVYCVYGADQYVRQTLFSIMSALRFEALTDRHWRIIIYTDNLDPYRQLNAALEYLDADTMREWAGPANFYHRRKIFALQHSLKKYGPSVIVDCDTYFLKSPRRLFDKVSPGNIIMHLCECRFDRLGHPDAVALTQSLCSAPFSICDQLYGFTMKSLMWNAGVVGLHPADAHLIEHVICLSDAIYQRSLTPSSGKAAAWCLLSEQVAWSRVLASAARMRECGDIVFHYWLDDLRMPFQKVLAERLEGTTSPMRQKLTDEIYQLRPQASRPQGVKANVKSWIRSLLFRAGWTNVGFRSSAGWLDDWPIRGNVKKLLSNN